MMVPPPYLPTDYGRIKPMDLQSGVAAVAETNASQGEPDFDDLPAFSVIVPAYNEEGAVEDTVKQLHASLAACGDYEIVIVNDGSTDRTGDLLRKRTDIRLIEHSRNRGYGAALKTGIRAARYPLIVITDSDGTYPNHRIPELVALAVDSDMVVGSRTGKNVQYPLIRKIPKIFLKRFAQWMAQREIPDMNSGLRVFHKDICEKYLNVLPNGFSFTTTITLAMLTNNYRVHYEPIDYSARVGKSKIKPIRDTLGFIQLILRTGMYFAPLRVFLPIAFVFFAVFITSLVSDLIRADLTESTLILFVATTQVGLFALLADMIDKRSVS